MEHQRREYQYDIEPIYVLVSDTNVQIWVPDETVATTNWLDEHPAWIIISRNDIAKFLGDVNG